MTRSRVDIIAGITGSGSYLGRRDLDAGLVQSYAPCALANIGSRVEAQRAESGDEAEQQLYLGVQQAREALTNVCRQL
jgi:hypothetical protein